MVVFALITLFVLIIFNLVIWSVPLSNSAEKKGAEHLNNFSILIAARNEEANLPALFNSLKNLNYPREHFEVIFVNDNSTDNTLEVAREHAKEFGNCTVASSGEKIIQGKKGALEKGAELSKFPIIVTTDADCILPPNWLREINQRFNNGADVVIGFNAYENLTSFQKKYSAYESLRNQIFAFTMARIGLPYSSVGRNFAFKKEILEKIGGYSAIAQTLSGDDDLLVQQAIKFKANIQAMLSKSSITKTKPPENFSELFKQRSRHVTTSRFYNLKSQVLLAFWHLSNLAAFYSLFLLWFNPIFSVLFLEKILFDLISVFKFQHKWNYYFRWGEIVAFQTIYEFFVPLYFLKAMFGKTKWK